MHTFILLLNYITHCIGVVDVNTKLDEQINTNLFTKAVGLCEQYYYVKLENINNMECSLSAKVIIVEIQ